LNTTFVLQCQKQLCRLSDVNTFKHITFSLKKNLAFTLVELLIAMAIFAILGVGVSAFLKSQSVNVKDSAAESKNISEAARVFKALANDIQKIDRNWQKAGIPTVFPNPGYGESGNAYVPGAANSTVNDLKNDAVVLLTTDIARGVFRVNEPLNTGEEGVLNEGDIKSIFGIEGTSSDGCLGFSLQEIAGSSSLYASAVNTGQWVIVFSGQQYFISQLNRIDFNCFSLKYFHSDVDQGQGWRIDGMLNHRLGLRYTNFDLRSLVTPSDLDDDEVRFPTSETFLQPVEIIVYKAQKITDNGQPYNTYNELLRDNEGRIKTGIYRGVFDASPEFTDIVNYELIAQAYGLEVSYDVKESVVFEDQVNVLRDVGLTRDNVANLFINPTENPNPLDASVFANPNIVSINMNIKIDEGDGKIATLSEKIPATNIYSDSATETNTAYKPDDSGNVHERVLLGENEQMGNPLFYEHGKEKFIVVPVFSLDSAATSKGKLVFIKPNGCAATEHCGSNHDFNEAVDTSAVKNFTVTFDQDKDFYPTRVQQVKGEDQKEYLMVSGIGLDGGVRKPMVATISINDAMTIEGQLEESTTGSCSIENCRLEVKNNNTALRDTANGFLEHNGQLITASVTKDNPQSSNIKLFQTSIDDNGVLQDFSQAFEFETDVIKGRTITAISNKVIYHEGVPYVPMCLSRKVHCTRNDISLNVKYDKNISMHATLMQWLRKLNPIDVCYAQLSSSDPCTTSSTQRDGQIVLAPIAGSGDIIKIADHNYQCQSLQTFGDHLIVGGKLTSQIITPDEIKDIANSSQPPLYIYTDEMADASQGYYAGSFQVDASKINEKAPSQYQLSDDSGIHWSTGTQIQTFSDDHTGLVFGNRLLNTPDSLITDQNVLSLEVNFSAEVSRIFASINTNMQNFNKSTVQTVFTQNSLDLPGDTVLPGQFLFNASNPRTEVMPLPGFAPIMSESDWLNFFLDLKDPVDKENNEISRADNETSTAPCGSTLPENTCWTS